MQIPHDKHKYLVDFGVPKIYEQYFHAAFKTSKDISGLTTFPS